MVCLNQPCHLNFLKAVIHKFHIVLYLSKAEM